MEFEGVVGEDFHPPLEPIVIINSQECQDEEEENFFTKLRLCRKSRLKSNQISQLDQFRNHLSFLRNEVQFKCQSDEATAHSSEITFPVIRNSQFKQLGKRTAKNKSDFYHSQNNHPPVRLITKEEACQPYTKRKTNPLEQCPVCKKYFRRMKTHLLKHEILENQNGLVCNVCLKVFHTENNLQIHMRTHRGDKPYVCEVCHKSFTQSCNLVNHVRIHTGEKPYKCPHCERAFAQSGNLNNHIRLHTDEKPFKCHFCDKAFVQSGNLNSHIRNNHPG